MAAKPKIKLNITERDLGMGHILREAAKLRKKPFVKVGVTQRRGSKMQVIEQKDGSLVPGPKTVADVAQFHEYGTGKVPERSFIRSTVSKNQSRYDAHIEHLKDQIFDASKGMTTEKALGLIGQEVSSDMKATIRAKIPPPLKEATIRAKNAGKIAEAQAHLNAGGSAKDFTKAGSARNERAEKLVETGGESTPLIDTGQLINSISYEVAMNGEGSALEGGAEGPKTY